MGLSLIKDIILLILFQRNQNRFGKKVFLQCRIFVKQTISSSATRYVEILVFNKLSQHGRFGNVCLVRQN